MARKRTPYEIEKSNIIGYPAANAEETNELVKERFGPPEIDEEAHTFGQTLIDGDVNPFTEAVQRPKRR